MSDKQTPDSSNGHNGDSGQETHSEQHPHAGCIVCIGASAGGLQAISDLLDNLDQGQGLSLIIAQHRGEQQNQDMLGDLLARHTSMPLVTAEHGMTLRADTVHVIPPNTIARLDSGKLQLRRKEPREMVIDSLFASLAREAGRHGVAVVLSGSNTDGTQGAREVRAQDGLVLAQQPETAEYRTMPQSVINEGLADDILAPADIPGRILEFARHLASAPHQDETTDNKPTFPPELRKKLLAVLEARTGQDFSNYKVNTGGAWTCTAWAPCRTTCGSCALTRMKPRPCSGSCSSA